MRFVVDCMLGKLAKWLRILGFDAVFFSKIEDNDLINYAEKEGRILLTRDSGLIEKAGEVQTFFVHSQNWREQVHQVLDGLGIRSEAKPYSRCIECNTALKVLSKEQARNLVSPFVYERCEGFALCPHCGRIFWKGSHQKNMETKIDEILKGKKD